MFCKRVCIILNVLLFSLTNNHFLLFLLILFVLIRFSKNLKVRNFVFLHILLFQQPFLYKFMYIVLPSLDTLTSAPVHTLHTHLGYIHICTHIWICTAGMTSVTMVYLYICVCMCVSV